MKTSIEQLLIDLQELKKQNTILKEQLKETEWSRNDFLTRTLNTIGDPFFIKDHESRLLLVNDAFCELFEMKREDIIGKTLAEDVPPNERENFLAVDRGVIESGIEHIQEESLTVRDQATRTLSTRKSRFLDVDGNKFLVGIIRDITERVQMEIDLREREEQFRSFFTQSQAPSAILDMNERIVNCNQSFCRFIGYSEKELIGKSMEDLLVKSNSSFHQLTQNATHSAIHEIQFAHKNGALRWGAMTLSVIYNQDSLARFFCAIIKDVTEQHLANEALERSRAELLESNRAKDRIFSIIAHDLRSPLSSVVALSSLLKLEDSDLNQLERRELIGKMDVSVKNTLGLLDNLLSWSRAQTGRLRIEKEPIALEELAANVLSTNSSLAELKRIQLINSTPPKSSIFSDKGLVQIILQNLVSNAIKFTKEGGQVEISAIERDHLLDLIVQDSGIGIDRTVRETLFDLSTNVSQRGTNNEKGSGLGLILCKELVEKLNGTISVESERGIGSRFIITLPKQ